MDLQCLFIGQQSKLYADLLTTLNELDVSAQVKIVEAERERLPFALKTLKNPSLIFISDDVDFPLNDLSDLVWRFSPDSIVVILVSKSVATKKIVKPFNTTQFSRLKFVKDDEDVRLLLLCLVQVAQLKADFRLSKSLLGISEKRCQWLVESSQEAIAYITRDLHIYANASYLALFDLNSIQELRSIPVKDLVEDGEYALFSQFINSQEKKHTLNHSIVITMKKNNGESFRANVHIIPSVHKGKRCLQLWVGVVDKLPVKVDIENKDEDQALSEMPQYMEQNKSMYKEEPNPFLALEKKTVSDQERIIDRSAIILEIIKREEASLSAQKLKSMDLDSKLHEHHLLSLKMAETQRKYINNLLFKSSAKDVLEEKQIFWDKVKFTKFFQVLSRKSELNMDLLIEVSLSSIFNDEFRTWLEAEIAKLGKKAGRLIFLVSSQFDDDQKQELIVFSRKLKTYHCKISLDKFTASNQSLVALKFIKPNYVRLSLAWVKKIQGNKKKESALSNYIQQLEKRDIRVIVPCGFNKNMDNVFLLSGVSFCLEKI